MPNNAEIGRRHEGQEFSKLKDFLYKRFSRIMRELATEENAEKRFGLFRDRILFSAQNAFPQHYEEVKAIIEGANLSEDFLETLSSKMAEFLSSRYDLPELERLLREGSIRGYGHTELNRLMSFDIDNGEIQLHVYNLFIDNPVQLKSLAMEAFGLLARSIQGDPSLLTISRITGRSWIVYHNMQLLERLGFIITEVDEKTETAKAEIDTSVFIQLYANIAEAPPLSNRLNSLE